MDTEHTRQRVVAVVPTYNEATVVGELLVELLDRPCRPDVIVVDDNSPDGTASLVRSIAAGADGRVQLLERTGKLGLGTAYAAGFRAALANGPYDVVVQLDADGSHPVPDLDRLVDALDDADLAIGSRYVDGGAAAGLTGPRRLLSRAGNRYARTLLGTGVRDLTGGYKAWRSELLRRVDPGTATSDGYAFQVEMTVRASRIGARIAELPIEFGSRRGGESKMDWRIAAEAVAVVPWLAVHYIRHGGHDRLALEPGPT